MSPSQQSDGSWVITCGGQVDGDGSPRCYGPDNSGLDYTANAGHPGNWWGVKTNSGRPDGVPLVDPASGLWISDTSLHIDGEPINAEIFPGIVVPAHWAMSVKGEVLGCKATVTNIETGIVVPCVVFDIGPGFGEMSIAAAIASRRIDNSVLNDIVALRALVRGGGISRYIFRYQIWPGIAADGFSLQRL